MHFGRMKVFCVVHKFELPFQLRKQWKCGWMQLIFLYTFYWKCQIASHGYSLLHRYERGVARHAFYYFQSSDKTAQGIFENTKSELNSNYLNSDNVPSIASNNADVNFRRCLCNYRLGEKKIVF